MKERIEEESREAAAKQSIVLQAGNNNNNNESNSYSNKTLWEGKQTEYRSLRQIG